ncbi:MAG: GAF domain-containing protein [Candidatus Omnitrophota bacterium]
MKREYTYLLEVLLGIAVILFINVMWFPADMGFIGVPLSPYWIVVLFVAARYGSFPGFVSGLACSAALLISVSYNTAIEQQLEFAAIPLRQIQLSAFFILIGFLLGEERSRVNLKLRKSQEKHNKLRDDFEALAMEHLALKNVNTELQGRILGQADTVNTIYEAAKELVTLKVDALYPSIVRLTKKMIGPERCSLYIWENDKYVLRGSLGWNGAIEPKKTLNTQIDIVKKAIAENAVTTVADVFRSQNLSWKEGEDPCMVAPLFFGEQTDVPAGFIVIDEISFMEFNPDKVKFLRSLADWASKSLDNAQATTMVRRKDVYDDDLHVYNYAFAVRKLREELLNAQVTGRPSCLLFIKLGDFAKASEEDKKRAQRTLLQVLGGSLLRASDTVTKSRQEDTFLAILSGSDKEGAKVVQGRIQTALEKTGRPLEVIFAARGIDAELKDVNDLFTD